MPALDGYINSTSMVLWPRLQQLMDAQADSLRKFGVPTGARRGEGSLAPHPVTVRFAGLLEGLLTLCEEGREDEPLVNRYPRTPNPPEKQRVGVHDNPCAPLQICLLGLVWDVCGVISRPF